MFFSAPMKFCIISFLSVVTFPLAVVAGITTTLAFSVLVFRVSLVYVDFLISFIPTYVFGRHTYSRRLQNARPSPFPASPTPTRGPSGSYTRRPYRRRSSASAISVEAPSPAAEHHHGLGLMSSAGMDRDFEGLGGWREGDDELWTTINSRFEMSDPGAAPAPAPAPAPAAGHNHYRTLSGGRILRAAEGGLTMRSGGRSPGARWTPPVSPNMSKARTAPPGGVLSPFSAVAENTTY